MEPEFYFVTGLPRSRTGWLANLLTVMPGSFCFHDGSVRCGDVAEMRGMMGEVGCDYVGNADSGLPWIWEELLVGFRKARLVVVLRSKDEVTKSFKDYFGRYPYPGMGKTALDGTGKMVGEGCRKLYEMIEGWPREQLLTVDFAGLEEERVVQSVYSFLLPRVVFSSRRWELLNALRVNVASEKVRVNGEKWKAMYGKKMAVG